jgi:hypothetical protein
MYINFGTRHIAVVVGGAATGRESWLNVLKRFCKEQAYWIGHGT